MESGWWILLVLLVVCLVPVVLVMLDWRKIATGGVAPLWRRREYLPPQIKIEGYGIRRGLTTVEAALLAQTPLNEVLGIVLAGLMTRGVLRVTSDHPLRFEADTPLSDALDHAERGFVRICLERVRRKQLDKLRSWTIALIKAVSNKVRGFSRRETIVYYAAAMDRAIEKARSQRVQELVALMAGDLSDFCAKIMEATNPFTPEPGFRPGRGAGRFHGGGGGRSGGGSCACACAGCACACAGCACACAGGGR